MTVYEIRVKGHLDQRWSAWFDGMTITNKENGDAIISGPLVDQAALHSVLVKIYNLNTTERRSRDEQRNVSAGKSI